MAWITGGVDAEEYDAAFAASAAAGRNVHGEADFVEWHGPRSVLDSGCGTGRVARELARRGIEVAGVDLDPQMLAVARRAAPQIDWRVGDLTTVDLGRTFEAVVLAGNVLIFLTPGTEQAVLANMARHMCPDGLLIAGYQVRPDGLSPERYDRLAAAAGCTLVGRWATWERDPWRRDGDYAVSVHRKGVALR